MGDLPPERTWFSTGFSTENVDELMGDSRLRPIWQGKTGTLKVDRSIERILIIHQGALGDFICCLPALASLRQALPHAHVTLMGYPRILQVAENRYYADAVISVDTAHMALLYQEGQEYPTALRDFFGTFQLIGLIGLNRNPFVENLRKISRARVLVIPPFPPEGEAVHMVDHLSLLPRCLGFPMQQEFPQLVLLERDRVAATAFLQDRGIGPDATLIGIHPGSGSPAKTWPLERFLELAGTLVGEYRAQILFIVGPGEEEIKQKLLRLDGPNLPVLLDGLPLPNLGAILERCLLFIGSDSGITHMAAAVGTPVVTIFGPSDPIRWAPKGREISLIRRAVSCSPCTRETMSRCRLRRCLLEISVEEVSHAVHRVIAKRGEEWCNVEAHRLISPEKLEATGGLPQA